MGTHRAHRAVDDHSGRCAGQGARHGARMGIRASTRIARRLEPVQRRSATVANPTAKVRIKMKSIRSHTFFALVSLATVAGAHAVSAANEVREEFRQTYPLDKQGKVRLDNVNGNVRIVTWDREEIKVEAIKRAKKQEHLDEVKIEVDAKADRIRIRTKYPDSKLRRNKDNSVSVDYLLTVPKQSRLERINTVNGKVEIEQVSGDVEASSVNGNVTAAALA